jgi:hypothetical protein
LLSIEVLQELQMINLPNVNSRSPERQQPGKDDKPDGAKRELGDVSLTEPPLDPAAEAVLEDKGSASPLPIIPDDAI